MEKIPEPSSMGLVFEMWVSPNAVGYNPAYYFVEKIVGEAAWNLEYSQFDPYGWLREDWTNCAYKRHSGRSNVLYADTHAESRGPAMPYLCPEKVIWKWSGGNPVRSDL
jgi:prepilin-type processing-associated H-X9-DG protein